MPSLASRVSNNPAIPVVRYKRLRRTIAWGIAAFIQYLLTRVTIEGLENIPEDGPVLVLPNHLSNLDGGMMVATYPRELDMVGPGDFKMVTVKDWLIQLYGMVQMKRGQADKQGLKTVISYLQAGKSVLMFPGGGMWEKRLSQVKPGAAYFSQATQAPMLPVALGGTYMQTMESFKLKRPKTLVRFGELMPPVPPSKSRANREADLKAASDELMQRIYDLLPREDQALYDRWERELYTLKVSFARYHDHAPVKYDGPDLPDMAAFGELIAKPNLFRPFWQNSGYPMEPFRLEGYGGARYFSGVEVKRAARELLDIIRPGGIFAPYIPYRMGDAAWEDVIEFAAALPALADWALEHDAYVKLTPMVFDPEDHRGWHPAESTEELFVLE